jgi:hypothetical protein
VNLKWNEWKTWYLTKKLVNSVVKKGDLEGLNGKMSVDSVVEWFVDQSDVRQRDHRMVTGVYVRLGGTAREAIRVKVQRKSLVMLVEQAERSLCWQRVNIRSCLVSVPKTEPAERGTWPCGPTFTCNAKQKRFPTAAQGEKAKNVHEGRRSEDQGTEKDRDKVGG